MVALGVILSSIAWYWHRPVTAIAILMGFAAIDLVLFTVMRDMLVCYRCAAKHRGTDPGEAYPRFDLEVAERYRQQALRMDQVTTAAKSSTGKE